MPPVYPEIAKRMHISGKVELQVTVDAQGKVKDVKPMTRTGCFHPRGCGPPAEVCGDGDSVLTVTIHFALPE